MDSENGEGSVSYIFVIRHKESRTSFGYEGSGVISRKTSHRTLDFSFLYDIKNNPHKMYARCPLCKGDLYFNFRRGKILAVTKIFIKLFAAIFAVGSILFAQILNISSVFWIITFFLFNLYIAIILFNLDPRMLPPGLKFFAVFKGQQETQHPVLIAREAPTLTGIEMLNRQYNCRFVPHMQLKKKIDYNIKTDPANREKFIATLKASRAGSAKAKEERITKDNIISKELNPIKSVAEAKSDFKLCNGCGVFNAPTNRFCNGCGIENFNEFPVNADMNICGKCGYKSPNSNKFCNKCGSKL